MEWGERQSVVVERVIRVCGVGMIEIISAGWMGDGIRVLEQGETLWDTIR
jgi:hypothetical protein